MEPSTDEPRPEAGTDTPPDPHRWVPTERLRLTAVVVVAAVAGLVATVAVTAAAGAGDTAPPPPATGPERTVADFLAAVRDKDVDRALRIAGVDDPPTGKTARFLDPDAISDEWEVRSVAETARSDTTDPQEWARVEVTIAGPQGQTTATVLDLTRTATADDDRGGWEVDDPFVDVTFVTGPLWYIDVNGARATAPDRATQEYDLLPGLYHFHQEPPDGVDAQYGMYPQFWPGWNPELLRTRTELLALPGTLRVVGPAEFALTSVGREQVRQAVRDYIDVCAESNERVPPGCPFDVSSYTGLTDYNVHWSYEDDVHWSVVEYPTLAIVDSRSGIDIADRSRGVVQLRGTVRSSQRFDEGAEATIECEMLTTGLRAGFTIDGGVAVEPSTDMDHTDICRDPVPSFED